MNKKILIYLGDHETKKPVIQRVLNDLDLPYQILSDKDIQYTCGYLMGIEGCDDRCKDESHHFASDLMILKDISDDEILAINALLDTMQLKMKRKAMLTKYNQHWFVCDLIQEIEKEHRYFQQVDEIKKILSSSKGLIIDDYTPVSWSAYEKAFYEAYQCIQKDITSEDMNIAYQKLISARKQLEKKHN